MIETETLRMEDRERQRDGRETRQRGERETEDVWNRDEQARRRPVASEQSHSQNGSFRCLDAHLGLPLSGAPPVTRASLLLSSCSAECGLPSSGGWAPCVKYFRSCLAEWGSLSYQMGLSWRNQII